jgi:preprotein translocase subunit SecF
MLTLSWLGDKYVDNLSYLWIIPLLLFVGAIATFGYTYSTTGDMIYRDLSLSGGVSLTVLDTTADADTVQASLSESYPNNDINVRTLTELGDQIGLVVEADITSQEQDQIQSFTATVSDATGTAAEDISVDSVGASLGQQFFQQTMKALWVAFLFMGACVFYYFGDTTKRKIGTAVVSLIAGLMATLSTNPLVLIAAGILTVGLLVVYAWYSIPSIAVILAAFSDIVITVAVLSLLQIKIGTASIAALLMLIGYSVDTDILLSTRVVKEREDEYRDRVTDAFTTGITMTLTTLSAVTVTYLVAQSQTLSQIMLVLVIGLLVDIINTWLQNAPLLDIHLHWDKR